MKTHAPLHALPFYQAPDQDEIAMRAYLNWEKAGQPADSAARFWNEAEAQLCAERQVAAVAAAERANRPWPPARIIPTAPSKLKKLASARTYSNSAKKPVLAKAKAGKSAK